MHVLFGTVGAAAAEDHNNIKWIHVACLCVFACVCMRERVNEYDNACMLMHNSQYKTIVISSFETCGPLNI